MGDEKKPTDVEELSEQGEACEATEEALESLCIERRDDGIVIVTINRPERRNALDRPTLAAGRQLIRDIHYDKRARVLIVTGAGDKAFCAGADLKEREHMTMVEVRQYIRYIRDTFTEVENLPIPVIAAINGVSMGGGTELALACDIRVIDPDAKMALNETSLAIIPGGGGTVRLPRLVGRGRAKDIILTARWVPAEEALSIGMVQRISPKGKCLEHAIGIAEQIIQNGPIAITQAKYVINRGLEVPIEEALQLESDAYEVCIPTKDRVEALNAFIEKRKPDFKGE
ncbi:MAG: enoyl-CoA hydratase [Thermoplasmata archaeon]|nr:enoyl-CoA hydratase [Thermoplasmata archaeon]NIS13440.1 enoyl-CoA hydratase [Thermoplasmata archaeon]NIS21321.1 enoyl-CoA hydratase [Thermoplasmata archaeon]NIT78842.1 enoyl-CoA hydratase [Thermoplasmata archaeon]NIU50374.1 enoyl-CoA hydratase [Thermoplasmata archaeon]